MLKPFSHMHHERLYGFLIFMEEVLLVSSNPFRKRTLKNITDLGRGILKKTPVVFMLDFDFV